MHQLDVADQLVGVFVGCGIAFGVGRFGLLAVARDRRVEPRQHAGDELPEQLAGVARGHAGAVGQCRQRRGDGGAEVLRQRGSPLADAEVARQVGQPAAVAAQARQAHLPQRVARDRAGHEGVAVAVAADPRAEAEHHRQLQRLAGELLRERGLDAAVELRHDVEQVLVEEVQAPGHFLIDRGLVELQLAGEPQQLDLVADRAGEVLALAVGPARRLQVEQAQVDAAVAFEHRHALGLGRVRGDDRADAQAAQRLADLLRIEPGLDGGVEHVREGAAHLRVATLALDLATAPHVAVLLGDRQQLEPDRLRLDRAGQQAGGHALLRRLAAQHARDLGLVAFDDADQRRTQQLRAGQRVGAFGAGGRLVGVREVGAGTFAHHCTRVNACATVLPSSAALGDTSRP